MSRTMIRGAAAVSLIFTAACTQYPAPVDLKGQNIFSRGGEQSVASAPVQPVFSLSFAPSAPVVLSSDQNVAAPQPVAVSELAAPQENLPSPSLLKPQQQANAGEIQKVNPWTGRPRTEFIKGETQVAEAKETKPVKLSSDQGARSADRASIEREQNNKFIWPVNGSKVISSFGPKGAGKANDGINIAAPEGEPVWAAADGEVVYVDDEIKGYGNMVLIRHAGNKTTTYAHLSSTTVDKYDHVKQGDIIGYVGSTGNVRDPQLHFAVRSGKDAVDPLKYVSRSVAGL